jgi:hypothetical protein
MEIEGAQIPRVLDDRDVVVGLSITILLHRPDWIRKTGNIQRR